LSLTIHIFQILIGLDNYCDPLANACNKMHRVVELETAKYMTELKRFNYTTPTSYLELTKLYVDILKSQQGIISGKLA
jgi:dynein heavy chain